MNRHSSGYSLLEVLISISILSLGLAGLFSLTGSAQTKSVLSQELSIAQLACRTRVNEIMAGSVPLQTITDEPIQGLDNWTLSVELDTLQRQGILAAIVIARKQNAIGPGMKKAGRFQVVQWINVSQPPVPVSVSSSSPSFNSDFVPERSETLDGLFSQPSLSPYELPPLQIPDEPSVRE